MAERRLYNPDVSIYFDSFQGDDALETARILSRNGYVVMISREEDAYIIDGIHTYHSREANRNDVVFISREDYEWDSFELQHEENQVELGVNAMRDFTYKSCDCSSIPDESFWREDNE